MKWLWPASLFGRLVIVLVAGTMTAQVLTGFIWYDMNYGKALEIPTRVLAAKLSDSISLIEISKIDDERLLLNKLSNSMYRLSTVNAPPRLKTLNTRDRAVELLFKHVFEQEFGRSLPIRIWDIDLHDDHGKEAGWLDLFESHYPSAHFVLYVQLDSGKWLQLDAYEGQAGMSVAPIMDLFDYLFRIYFIRIIVIVGIALFAVRQIMRPLNRLAAAAERLGRNIYSPPLDVDGPTEVRRSAKAFNLMQQRLIDTVTEKTRFLAAISHDLRSPITRMRLRAEQIDKPALREKFRRDLEDMESLISSTVDYMRGVEVHENRHPININAMLQSLQIDAIEVMDSPERLRIAIRDQGPGIPEHLLNQVFEPFYRVETSRNAATGGSGLGLSIAKTIVEAHDGKIHLRNMDSGGLEVVVDLPRQFFEPAAE
ncbi:ATP-binding protein [Methylobacillus flagellatus]|uniref:histidine kinase n=1 Tax=Methylobacillus flagellatus (strain ATCC 51484 / DSM 6875 / VKM B-1610 / KT) TaxID=265072 RepID=Q1GXN6_METFK|nr:ATP-binding protein [Methylobacillus flagellatus]ABE51001.1 periplasmic sensor signal transduction histidine kinase [Methylobacillus flagellatus KT]